ncbi:MAG TPA: hypothetical protein VI603_07505 [Saprospiraceae bacterium]|nr:hypothetical protein [Saprospiraceae bacterium]
MDTQRITLDYPFVYMRTELSGTFRYDFNYSVHVKPGKNRHENAQKWSNHHNSVNKDTYYYV